MYMHTYISTYVHTYVYVLACDIKLIGIAVLKKYYGIILASLPDNHTKSISVLSENAPVDEAFFNEILSLTDCKEANHRILNAIILMMKSDNNIIGVCKLVRMLVGSKRFSKEILEFESGKVITKSFIRIYITCIYICMHICMRTIVLPNSFSIYKCIQLAYTYVFT